MDTKTYLNLRGYHDFISIIVFNLNSDFQSHLLLVFPSSSSSSSFPLSLKPALFFSGPSDDVLTALKVQSLFRI